MKTTDFQYTFESVVSYDEGETTVPVTVAYDYLPEELNYPHAPDYAEEFDVFVFDANGKDITYDIPQEETERLLDEAKEDFRQEVEAANAY
jgi:hypothetical protein